MFPLLDRTGPNRLELFQIWLNLPRKDKMAAPHFKMLWGEDIPAQTVLSDGGASTRVAVVAGRGFLPPELEAKMPSPPPASYAHDVEQSDVAIVTLEMKAGASYTLPPARRGAEAKRKLFFFKGKALTVDGRTFEQHMGIELRADVPCPLVAGADGDVELLMLQGVPIGEPQVQHGPFLMTTREEIMQAFMDYQKDEFGAWPHKDDAPVHPCEATRFAKHADGTLEERPWPASRIK
jgi:redox-sensitive bicupin YhaK (pirin superfamily)